ncbi:unnamed protein product [Allacma fusca]|uniref:Uncharacterized protein n=1 Tax=Allacma fusca TaxID=39272 RepID=A0A8J2NWR3_9HEXA|nr:unnamed protein product [Allacma fusca]
MSDCDPDDELIDIVGSPKSHHIEKMKLRDEEEDSLIFSLNYVISSVNRFIDGLSTSRLSPGSNNEVMELASDEEMVPESENTDSPIDTVDCQPPPAKIAKIIDELSYMDCHEGRKPARQNNFPVNGKKLSFNDDSGFGTSGDSNVKSTSAQSDTASNRVVSETADVLGRPRFRRRSKRAVTKVTTSEQVLHKNNPSILKTTNDQVGNPNGWKDSGRNGTEHSEELLMPRAGRKRKNSSGK